MPRVIKAYEELGSAMLSVIVLTHGRDLCRVRKIIEMLRNQTYSHFELIVASETNGDAIADLLRSLRPGVKGIVFEGSYFNRALTANIAVQLTNGKYIAVLEDDLIFGPNFLVELISEFQEKRYKDPKLGVLACRSVDIFYKKSLIYYLKRLAFVVRMARILDEMPLLKQREPVAFGTCFVALREVLISVPWDHQLPEPVLGEDYDLAMRVRKAGYRIAYSDKVMAVHTTLGIIKRSQYYRVDPKAAYCEYFSNTFFFVRNMDLLGFSAIGKVLYNLIFQPINVAIRSKSIMACLQAFKGALIGLV